MYSKNFIVKHIMWSQKKIFFSFFWDLLWFFNLQAWAHCTGEGVEIEHIVQPNRPQAIPLDANVTVCNLQSCICRYPLGISFCFLAARFKSNINRWNQFLFEVVFAKKKKRKKDRKKWIVKLHSYASHFFSETIQLHVFFFLYTLRLFLVFGRAKHGVIILVLMIHHRVPIQMLC